MCLNHGHLHTNDHSPASAALTTSCVLSGWFVVSLDCGWCFVLAYCHRIRLHNNLWFVYVWNISVTVLMNDECGLGWICKFNYHYLQSTDCGQQMERRPHDNHLDQQENFKFQKFIGFNHKLNIIDRQWNYITRPTRDRISAAIYLSSSNIIQRMAASWGWGSAGRTWPRRRWRAWSWTWSASCRRCTSCWRSWCRSSRQPPSRTTLSWKRYTLFGFYWFVTFNVEH